jgi:hypothetical protein
MMTQHNKLLIASSSPDEAITQTILNNLKYFDYHIDIIFIHELLSDFNINDELSDAGSIIRWFKPNQPMLSNKSHYLLNRTLFIADNLFLNFIKQDREYAKREFEAYLGYSFNSFKGIGNQTVNGICEILYSLPEQWQRLQKKGVLNTPLYYWGPKHLCHLKQNLIYADIYDFYHWKVTAPKPSKTHIFCFEKPPGHPIFILSLGEKTLFSSDLILSKNMHTQLLKHLKSIRACFGYFIFEVLLFIHNHHIYFGCVNLNLTRTAKHPDFEPFVRQHLIREYFKCPH